jgi:prepilin-type N-terminal cleavage/methylation domain-containing protein
MIGKRIRSGHGFSLVELTIVIVVIGILVSLAMQSMTALVEDSRRAKTEREMEVLAKSIVGDPSHVNEGGRSNFGYVGDIGAFPPNLQALYQNPGGYGTWNGPYLPPGFSQDSVGFKTDEWGQAYAYSGGITITSTGSGSAITKKIADATSDYLLNTVNGTIEDADDSLPGPVYKDSIDIKITIPNGSGSLTTKTYHPDSVGVFRLDSLPVGMHALRIIYTPSVDTLFRYLTILPRHKSTADYKFASGCFSGGGGGCDSSGTIVLRPNGVGTLTALVRSGCGSNWQCVDEATADEDNTRVERPSNSFATDVYLIDDPPATTCPIIAVRVYCRARRTQSQGSVMPTVYVNGTEYNGSSQALTQSYVNYSHEWTVNPNTGASWTWPEITYLQAGVALRGQNVNFPARCTQIWVEVDYQP